MRFSKRQETALVPGQVVYCRFLGAIMMPLRRRAKFCLRRVTADWIAALPREKAKYFDSVVGRWECTYAMMSVALDDAVTFRTRGELVGARQHVCIAAVLLGRLADSLTSFCEALCVRGRRLGMLPAVEPLKPEFFRGDTAQSAASWNEILHHVLFGNRSRFFHKVRILSETLARIALEFDDAATDVSKGMAVHPGDSWARLDSLHYDFNTCLRETEVVLKSFLRVIPADQLVSLPDESDGFAKTKTVRIRPRLSRATA